MNLLFVFIFASLLVSCTAPLKKTSSQSGSECFRLVGQNLVLEFLAKKEECQSHRSEQGTTILMLAAARGHLEILKEVLNLKVDVNEADFQGDTALHYAVSTNKVAAAQLLMEAGARVKSRRPDGVSTLMQAIQFGSLEMVKILSQDFEAINDPAQDGWTPLYFAIRRNDIRILDQLLQRGACPLVFDSYGQTPLEFAKEVKWVQAQDLLAKVQNCKDSTL